MKSAIINSLTVILGLTLSTCAFSDTLYDSKNFDKDVYEKKDIDINFDGVLDYVVYSKPFMGDELYFFINKNNKYYLSLKGYNFSQDGGYIMTGIYPASDRSNRINIRTSFPGSGNSKIDYLISYKNNKYYLDETIYTVGYSFDDDRRVDVCTVKQNIDLQHLYLSSSITLHNIPDEDERDDKCIISFKITASIDGFIQRVNEEPYDTFDTAQRYAELINKYKITRKNITKYNNLAYLLEKRKAYKESIFILRNIIRLYPSRKVAYINLGDALWETKDIEKAKDAYRTYINLMKKDGHESKIPKQVLKRVSL
ncbi:tetratricopeptide repeat protein [Vibrio sp. PP-XX7]